VRKDKLSYILMGIFGLLLMGTIAFLIIFSTLKDNEKKVNGVFYELTDWSCEYTDTDTGMPVRGKITAPCKINVNGGTTVIYTTVLPKDIVEGQWLCFYSGITYEVFVNDELRLAFYEDEADIPGGVEKAFYNFCPLYSDDSGAIVKVVRSSKSGNNGVFRVVYAGDGYGIIYKIISQNIIHYGGVLVLFAISLMGFGVGTVLRLTKKRNANLMLVSLGSLLLTAWLIFDGNLYQFMFHRIYIDGIISYMVTMLIPFPFILYLDRVQRERYHKWQIGLEIVDILFFIGTCIAHFAYGVSLADKLLLFIIPLVFMVVVEVGVILYDFVHKKTEEYNIVLLGFVFFTAFTICEMISVNIFENIIDGIWVIFGLYILAVAIVFQQIRESATLRNVLKEQDEQIKFSTKKARTDDLTGINNLRYLRERVTFLLENGCQGAFLMIDIDNFKYVNDNFGHIMGDKVLIEFAKALKKTFRSDDVVCRIGGDEFAVFIPGDVTFSQLEEKFETLTAYTGENKDMQKYMELIFISVGVSFAPEDGVTVNDLYTKADEAMYDVKKNGKNGISTNSAKKS